jgi:hypothetical protein
MLHRWYRFLRCIGLQRPYEWMGMGLIQSRFSKVRGKELT